jgi:hypothetical protein
VGIVVSFVPDEDSPFNDLPWVVTFRPRGDEGAWDSVVCGPYQREHAEALAEAVALDLEDDDIVAVAEPMLPALDPADIRDAIQHNREVAASVTDDVETDDTDEDGLDDTGEQDVEELPTPTPEEVRAGIDRVTRNLVTMLEDDEDDG